MLGAFGFVKSYRAVNSEDEIVVFSKEDFPFYNRVAAGLYQWRTKLVAAGKNDKCRRIYL